MVATSDNTFLKPQNQEEELSVISKQVLLDQDILAFEKHIFYIFEILCLPRILFLHRYKTL